MGAVLLALAYLVTAGALPLVARALGRRVSPAAALALALLPLAFTAPGFLPGRALTPTPLLLGVAPWADPELVERAGAAAEEPNPLLLDPLSQMIPWRRAARDGLLFNPAQGGGAALLGNGQSALLFPTEVVARWLSPFRAVTYSQAARLLLAVWGLFLLARALAMSEPAALAGAAVYLGAGFLQLWRLHPHSLVAALAPWILWAALALVRRPGPRPAAALAVAGALGLFGGHPETLLHILLLALAIAGVIAVGRWRLPAPRPGGLGGDAFRRLFWGAVAALLAFLLAAPALLPFVDNLAVSAEWQLRRGERRALIEVTPAEAAARAAPAVSLLALGDPRRDTWRGAENLAELGGGAVGAGGLLLALTALTGRRRRLAATLLGLGLLGLLVAAHTPWVGRPFAWVPLLRDSLLKRLTLWWVLAAALAAALAVEGLRRSAAGGGASPGRPARRGLLLPGAAVTALLAAVALALPGPEVPRMLAWEGGALAAALAGAWLLAGDRRRGRRLAATALLAAALLVPRVALLAGWVPRASADAFYAETLATRFVAERLAAAGPVGYRVAGLDAALVPHAAVFLGFEEVRAYDPLTLGRLEVFHAALGEPARGGWVRILDPARPALAFLGARWVFDHPSMVERPGVEVAYLGRDAIVYENPRALPRLFVPIMLEAHADPAAALAAARDIEDFAARATVTGAVLGVEAVAGAAVRRANGRARVEELIVGRGRLRATVAADSPALVASSQPAIPGWRLTVDGEPARPVPVNGAFLGVEVPAGSHRLAFDYAPASWRLGLWLGGVGLALTAALAWSGRRRRRR